MNLIRKQFRQIAYADGSINFASIANGAVGTADLTVPGAAVGDLVLLNLPSTLTAGLTATGLVTAANTVTIRLANGSGGAIDLAALTFGAAACRMF
jgi:hypothetical protein